MSSLGGPSIVTDGLVLLLDAGNSKSFGGEPTVNLISNNPIPTGTTNFSANGGIGTSTYDSSKNAVRWVRTSYEGWGAYYTNNSLSNYLFDIGSTYTISFKWKYGETHNAGTSHYFNIIQGNGLNTIMGGYQLISSSTLQSDGWYYFTKSAIPLNAGISQTGQPPGFRIICGNLTGLTTDIYWKEIQFEKKSYATPFVNGTRGGTVDTGGGWIDRSGNGNNGGLVNNPTYNSLNGGSIVFDGVDDYVEIANTPNINPTEQITISCFVKLTNLRELIYESLIIKTAPGTSFGQSQYGLWGWRGGGLFINGIGFRLSLDGVLSTVSSNVSNVDILNKWVYITATYNGSKMSIYYNGELKNSINKTGNIDTISDPLYIGRNGSNNNNYSSSNIPQVLIYNRALSTQEVLQNYNATKSRFGL